MIQRVEVSFSKNLKLGKKALYTIENRKTFADKINLSAKVFCTGDQKQIISSMVFWPLLMNILPD